jgi:HEAT repeat protein
VDKGLAGTDILKALVQIDPEGKECVPPLITALRCEDNEVVYSAATCLGVLGPRAREAIPTVIEVMTRDFNEAAGTLWHPQVGAAKALGRIDPRAEIVLPDLIRALKYRRTTRGHVGGDETQPQHRDCEAAAAAARVLGSLGVRARAAAPALTEAVRAFKDPADRPVRQAAALALGQIGPEGKAAIPVLRSFMQDEKQHPRYQAEAVIGLYWLAADGKDITEQWLSRPALSWPRRGWDDEAQARAMVLGAMGRTNFESDRLTRMYLKMLDEQLSHDQLAEGCQLDQSDELFETIGRLGVAGHLAIPRLNELRNDRDPFVRMWAAEALKRITPPTE